MGSLANKVESVGQQRDYEKQKGKLTAYIESLRAKGDPQGDYYYAMGNADGWIKDVRDPEAITQLFRDAAVKGSMDAKIILALQKATSEPVPGRLMESKGPRENLGQWEAGLAELKPLLEQQCYARRLVLDLGTPEIAKYSIANFIWPKFRDGYFRRNIDDTRTLLKDPQRQQEWERIDRDCDRGGVPVPDFK
ncbi:hypothetical protein [Hydrogenophaga sp. 5NK40-0174]|uniref:hypothetical protein n=1 Tax=Hydrogenophaga sp. 5NK40-0174 TaxID=3127649 RepID=UPI003340CCD6